MRLEPSGSDANGWWGRNLPWLSGVWTGGGAIVYLLWPALAPVILPLCLAMPLLWYRHSNQPTQLFAVSGVSTVLLIAMGYALVNASWSMASQDAYAYSAMLFVALLSLHIGLGAWARIVHRPAIAAMAVGFYVGFVLAGTFLCYEIFTNQTIFFRLVHVWPYDTRYLSADSLPSYYLNHRMAALAILFWPAFLTCLHLPSAGWQRWALLVGLTPALAAVGASEHATSQVALVLGACVALVSHWSLPATRRLLMFAWGLACVAVVPLCLAAYAANLHHYTWLPPSARHRVVIWKATSDLVPKAPVLGVGISSSRPLSRAPGDRQIAPGTSYPLAVALHSHNAFLQVWFEAGAVGAAILLSFGLITLRSIASLERSAQPALFASFASCAMISATGFSAFAPWQTASFAMCALFAALALAQLRSDVMLPRT